MRHAPVQGEFPVQLEALEAIEAEVSRLRDDLSETQERLDFTERLVVQGQEARRVGPER
jgi:predicted  nucleic acid-binding Zn-ribbon protein